MALEDNPNVLTDYANSEYKLVRQAIAQNPNTPWEILERLSQDNEKAVDQAARDNLKNKKMLNSFQPACFDYQAG